MDQPNPTTPGRENAAMPESLVPSLSSPNGVVRTQADAELAVVRQMMESLYARFEALQQNHAIQFAGVHERLDAVELEIPLVHERTALGMRNIESRLNAGIEEVRAELQAEVSGRLGSLSAQFETQHLELSRLQEAKQATEIRLNRALQDLERLTNSMGRQTAVHQPEHAPLVRPQADPPPPPVPAVPAAATNAPVQPRYVQVDPRFEEWKKQYMEFDKRDDSDQSEREAENPLDPAILTCPRCASIRVRPATPVGIDRLFRLAGLKPHRCRSCSHRFYKMGEVVLAEPAEDKAAPGSPVPTEALETQ
jgi:hypothetical protein